MTEILKPKDQKKPPPVAVREFAGGREVCNMLIKAGRDLYMQRLRDMWERQNRICCLHRDIRGCPGKLNLAQAVFEHEVPRGYGGGSRDDRIEVRVKQRGGTFRIQWQNGAAHPECNIAKGSRRIAYNSARDGEPVWRPIEKTSLSGKALFQCVSCGYETPAPTKTHKCPKMGG